MGRTARAFWCLTYDHSLWGPMLTRHLAMLEEDMVLGTLDKIPRKFGVSKEMLRDRSLLPEGYEATTNWWKSGQVAPRPRSVVEVPGVTDRRFAGTLTEMRKIGGEASYGFIHCQELKRKYGREVFVKHFNASGFKAGDAVSFRVIFKKERQPEAVELAEPDDTASPVGISSEEVQVDAQELARRGFVLQTVKTPDPSAAAAKTGDVVCVSYVGRLASDKTVFDAASNLRFVLGAGSVIPGWEMGIAEMRVGQEVRLVVHHSHAYGGSGAPTPEPVPPFANLDFSLLLVDAARPGGGPLDLGAELGTADLAVGGVEAWPDAGGIVLVGGPEGPDLATVSGDGGGSSRA
mmetsp:Transcript_44046/g.137127  ORF Transcript_44046/g.137127 Transcript_44046/m.137127 type:complete len:348 (+) Transcript_44046:1755-2798(+)